MATITLRVQKGTMLTHEEADANFTNINNEVIAATSAIDGINTTVTGLATQVGTLTTTTNAAPKTDDVIAMAIALG